MAPLDSWPPEPILHEPRPGEPELAYEPGTTQPKPRDLPAPTTRAETLSALIAQTSFLPPQVEAQPYAPIPWTYWRDTAGVSHASYPGVVDLPSSTPQSFPSGLIVGSSPLTLTIAPVAPSTMQLSTPDDALASNAILIHSGNAPTPGGITLQPGKTPTGGPATTAVMGPVVIGDTSNSDRIALRIVSGVTSTATPIRFTRLPAAAGANVQSYQFDAAVQFGDPATTAAVTIGPAGSGGQSIVRQVSGGLRFSADNGVGTYQFGNATLQNTINLNPGGTPTGPAAINSTGGAIVLTLGDSGRMVGVANGGNPVAGGVGETVQQGTTSGSAVTMTSGVATNIVSIALTAGDWDVYANIVWLLNGAPTVTTSTSWIHTAAPPATPTAPNSGAWNQTGPLTVSGQSHSIGRLRVSIGAAGNAYLGANVTFTGGTSVQAFGFIAARRRR